MLHTTFSAAFTLLLAAPADSEQYQARPIDKPVANKIVLKDTIWSCGDGGCTAAARSASRPAIVCASLVKKVGRVDSFAVAGAALAPAELEKCNARAD